MAPRARPRCPWPNDDPLLTEYHDTEWGVPVHDDRFLFEHLVLAGTQAGLSWSTVLRKRENYRRAFRGFEPATVARFQARDLRCLLGDAGLIRNRQKLEAAIHNARRVVEVQAEFGSLDAYLWGLVDEAPIRRGFRRPAEVPATTAESDGMSASLKARGFKFAGPTICYAFMQTVGIVNDHLRSCFRYSLKT